jgi:hypothetical protein
VFLAATHSGQNMAEFCTYIAEKCSPLADSAVFATTSFNLTLAFLDS